MHASSVEKPLSLLLCRTRSSADADKPARRV